MYSGDNGNPRRHVVNCNSTGWQEPPTLDIDAAIRKRRRATDAGVLVVRYPSALPGNALPQAHSGHVTRTDPGKPGSKPFRRHSPPSSLDIDGNGRVDAPLTGLLIVRHLLQLTSDALIAGAVDPAIWKPAKLATDIHNYLQALMP